jgi:hypothetical protein
MKTRERDALLAKLQARFEKNMPRHPGLAWSKVVAKLETSEPALHSLQAMEATGGEPDVVGQDGRSGPYLFMDCSAESPAGRRSLCFDGAALDARKEAKPRSSAMQTAASMGIELLTEDEYRALQKLGTFDAKTSSWIQTPAAIRKLGGALFCDYRYGQVFTYHNGAQSYYAARGFRGVLKV